MSTIECVEANVQDGRGVVPSGVEDFYADVMDSG
jgi:hypothetical protein